MSDETEKPDYTERRSEPRRLANGYYSVEFQVKKQGPIYQFKLWDVSDHGLSILVKEDSSVLNQLSVGDTLEMKYYSIESITHIKTLDTQIRHITKHDTGRFKGHFLVGLLILSETPSE